MHKSTQQRLRAIKALLKVSSKSQIALLNELKKQGFKGVSARNLLKDIKMLRAGKLNNLPLNIDFVQGKYQLIDSPLEHFSELSIEDQSALSIAKAYIKSLEHIPAVRQVVDFLEGTLGVPNTKDSFFHLRSRRTVLASDSTPPVFKRIIALHKAMRFGTAVQFQYNLVSEEKSTSKLKQVLIYPLRVLEWKERFYILGYKVVEDTLINPENVRVFALDTIASKIEEITTHSYNWKQLSDNLVLDNYFKHCIGIWNNLRQTPTERKWVFSGWAASHVQACPLHSSQEVRSLEGHPNKIIVSLKVHDSPELTAEIAQYREFAMEIHQNV